MVRETVRGFRAGARLEAWLRRSPRRERVHEVLTHVVNVMNDTHAVCDAIGAELWGTPKSVRMLSS
jgi:hypothetical protein